MKLSLASLAVSAAVAPAGAVNFLVIQPDDMDFYEEWNPPPHLPWSDAYPGTNFPGSSVLPNINKLHEEGLAMTQAYAASPKCGTSRYSTVTGRYATRSSHARNREPASPADASIPMTKLIDMRRVEDGDDCSRGNVAQVFKKNGWKTGMVGKWHLSKLDGNYTVDDARSEIVDCGFDDVEAMYPDNIMSQAWTAGIHHNMEYVAYKAVEFIEANSADDWFLYVNPTVPHGPSVEEAMLVDCRATVDGDFSDPNHPEYPGAGWNVPGMTDAFGGDCTLYRDDVKTRAQEMTDSALGAIWVDDAIGAIYSALERTGQLDDTFILFQLDHGKVGKDEIWEGGLRIPQFVRYGAVTNGLDPEERTFDGLVSTIDIAPTMLDFAGITKDNAVKELLDPLVSSYYDMDGKSWKTAVLGSDPKWPDRCLFFESNTNRAVRCGCDKYMELDPASDEANTAIANIGTNGWSGWEGGASQALFDMCDQSNAYKTADSFTFSPEAVNVAGHADQADKLADLSALLQCHKDRTAAPDKNVAPQYVECDDASAVATPSPAVTERPTLHMASSELPEVFADHDPWHNDLVAPSSSTILKATVIDDDLQRVRFNLLYPNGTMTGFVPSTTATEVWESGQKSTHELSVDTTDIGKYGYRIRVSDFSGNDIHYPSDDSDDWIEFVVASSPEDLLVGARAEIASIIQAEQTLAAKFVRHSFHDCVGGCDGCVDMTNGDNAGLDIPIAALEPVVDMFARDGVTRADIWVLAGLEGAGGSQNAGADNMPFDMEWWGRPNCDDANAPGDCVDNACNATRGPHRELPSPSLTTHGLLTYFLDEFDFTDRDTVAIMGAHSLGTLSRTNSGYDGSNGWKPMPQVLDNGYYDDLVGGSAVNADEFDLLDGGRWEQVFIDNSGIPDSGPSRWQWERSATMRFVMVNSDIALVRNLTDYMDSATGEVTGCQFRCVRANNCPANPRCPMASQTIRIVEEYKHDIGAFLTDFETAFKKMLHFGGTNYEIASVACSSHPCEVNPLVRRNLRGLKN